MKTTIRIAEVCAYCLAFLFVYAASSKLLKIDLFRFQLQGYPWIRHIAGLISWLIPVTLLSVSILLLSPRRRLAGFYGSFALMVMFTGYLGWMVLTEKELPCSCSGVIQGMSWNQHLLFNLVFVGLAVAGIIFSSSKTSCYET